MDGRTKDPASHLDRSDSSMATTVTAARAYATGARKERSAPTEAPTEALPPLPGGWDRRNTKNSSDRVSGSSTGSDRTFLSDEGAGRPLGERTQDESYRFSPDDGDLSRDRSSPATSTTSLNTFGNTTRRVHVPSRDDSLQSSGKNQEDGAKAGCRPRSSLYQSQVANDDQISEKAISSVHVDDELSPDGDEGDKDSCSDLFSEEESDGETAHVTYKQPPKHPTQKETPKPTARLGTGIQIRRWDNSVPVPPPRNGSIVLKDGSSGDQPPPPGLTLGARKLGDVLPSDPQEDEGDDALSRSNRAFPARMADSFQSIERRTLEKRTLRSQSNLRSRTTSGSQASSDAASQTPANGGPFYRPSALQTELRELAPATLARPVNTSFGISNLPDWSLLQPDSLTSRPITHVQRDMDWSLSRLMSQKVFEDLLADPLGRHRFREYLVQHQANEQRLDLFFDVSQFQKQVAALKSTAEAIHEVYLSEDSYGRVPLPEDIGEETFETLQKSFTLRTSLDGVQKHLLRSLYRNEFQSFIKEQLVQSTKVKLGMSDFDAEDLTGLGDCFCLTNPRLRENPIVLVSDAFSVITGYPRQAIIGRNCRFLQGPSTAPDSIQRVRDALNEGRSTTELLLNYRRDGTPFWCLLSIIPLREANGNLAYFIGGQTNVTGTLASSKGLSFLTTGAEELPESSSSAEQSRGLDGQEVSPSMSRYLKATRDVDGPNASTRSLDGSGSAGRSRVASGALPRERNVAAGSYAPAGMDLSGGDLLMGQEPPAAKRSLMSRMLAKSGLNAGNRQSARLGDHTLGAQKLEGAEVILRKEAYSLEEQMTYFTEVYSKLLIVRRQKREVLFATGPLLRFLGLAHSTASDVFASPLLHIDLLSLLCGDDTNETRAIRAAVQKAVRKGVGMSVVTGVRMPRKKGAARLLGKKTSDDVAHATLHLCPLKDRENSSFAMVAVFS